MGCDLRYFCDKCKNETKEYTFMNDYERGIYLCKECYKKFKRFMKNELDR